ncbi:MAG TPA: DUF4258 domain-containing protein [Candidatus Nanoarchaeia archaeon]|nr:DUF4258 domain-containing protein [Candidatus Nanoarchaeia archaeon]
MDIIYTEYAEETLSDRKIGKKEVESALLKPLEVVTGNKGRQIAHRLIVDKLLRVVFERDAKDYIVITAYYTKPARYVRQ